jgi:hypothetical protein
MAADPGLVVLAADVSMESLLRIVLSERRESLAQLGISGPVTVTLRHPGKDSGVLTRPHDLLRRYIGSDRRAVAVFDYEGCDRSDPAQSLEAEVEEILSCNGWRDRACALCVEPEFDLWTWARRPALAEVLRVEPATLARVLEAESLLLDARTGRPVRPKEALQAVVSAAGRRFSSSIHADIARRASLLHCQDRAFQKLLSFLRDHFPA